MFDWVDDVLKYGSGPLIAAVAVIVTQVTANRREDRRIAGERAERALDREHAATVALQERWRDERRAAYQRLLSTFDEAIKFGGEATALLGVNQGLVHPGSSLEKLDVLVSEVVAPAHGQVALIASDDTVMAATALRENLRLLKHALSLEDHKSARESLQTCRDLRNDYLLNARTDLGTP